MARAGRVIFWVCVVVALGFWETALYIFLTPPREPDDPMLSPFENWFTQKGGACFTLAFIGVLVVLCGWMLRGFLEDRPPSD